MCNSTYPFLHCSSFLTSPTARRHNLSASATETFCIYPLHNNKPLHIASIKKTTLTPINTLMGTHTHAHTHTLLLMSVTPLKVILESSITHYNPPYKTQADVSSLILINISWKTLRNSLFFLYVLIHTTIPCVHMHLCQCTMPCRGL